MAALVRAARSQQGRLRLLGWRQAVGEVQLECSALPAAAAEWQQQQAAGFRALAHNQGQVYQPWRQQEAAGAAWGVGWRWGCAAPLQATPPATHQQQQQQQRRGFALNFVRPQRRRDKNMVPQKNLPPRNEEIHASEVRVLFPGPEEASDVMQLRAAIKQAKVRGLDIVMVSPRAEPPVVRMIEWSKVLYEQQKRDKTAMKQKLAAQRLMEPKEIRISCVIAEHDLGVKMAQARRFLEEGNVLRLVVTFKGGAQIALGRDVTLYLIGQLADLCKVKDEKHLQRPMRGHWAVMLSPLAVKAAAGAPKAAPSKAGAAQAAEEVAEHEDEAAEEQGAAAEVGDAVQAGPAQAAEAGAAVQAPAPAS